MNFIYDENTVMYSIRTAITAVILNSNIMEKIINKQLYLKASYYMKRFPRYFI